MSLPEPAVLRPDILDRARTPFVAADLWYADAGSVEHISDGTGFIYRFQSGEQKRYLRLVPSGWRDRAGLQGELAYIETLRAAGIAVARPLPSRGGELIETVEDRGNSFLVVAFEAAAGRHVPVREWGEAHARRFGRLLAQVHAAAPSAAPAGTRPEFDDELALTRDWLPASETGLHAHLEGAGLWGGTLPRTPDVFGLVHFDLCEDNVLWVGLEPTVIDFDDCMFTWFAADIARTIGSLYSADPARYRQVAAWCMEGYRAVRRLDPVTVASLPEFVRLNAISNLAWCLYSRWHGLDIEDASEEAESHFRAVITEPRRWCHD